MRCCGFYLTFRRCSDCYCVALLSNHGAGPGALSRRGFNKGDLKIEDTLVVDGYRAKDGSHLIDARRVTLPDGRSIYGGTPGDGGPGDDGTAQGAQGENK